MQRGLTLVEVLVSIAILAIVSVGMVSAFLTAQAWTNLTDQRMVASNALRAQMEEILALEKTGGGIDTVLSTYSQTANQSFNVDDIDGTGAIVVYLDEDTVPVELGATSVTSTNAEGERFGPFDLDGDGSTGEDHSVPDAGVYGTNYAMLEVRVDWAASATDTQRMRRFLSIARVDE